MTDLNLSAPITLPYNQTNSIVIDGVEPYKAPENADTMTLDDTTYIVNYGLINNNNTFEVRCYSTQLNKDRDFSAMENDGDAKTVLSDSCATKAKNIKVNMDNAGAIGFTVKTFPHFGAYGFVNLDADHTDIVLGKSLNENRSSGGVFKNET